MPDLQRALDGGVVVIVNASRKRGDALIVTDHGEPVSVRLPHLTHDDIGRMVGRLIEVTLGSAAVVPHRRRHVLTAVLSWLWDTIAHPVIQVVTALCGTSKLPRVWWLPTGMLSIFPLHAAGHPGQSGVLDLTVSSYTPTLRSLERAHRQTPVHRRRQLIVALSHTPGLPDLPGTVAEATALHAHHPHLPLLRDDTATTDRVLAALTEATWAHFACHADVDFIAPSRSGLRLYDAVLSLPEIGGLQLEQAELAYLSACSTANRGIRHGDESLHPAAAFQLAGFRHVIASLWPLADVIAADAATLFYENLTPGPSAVDAADALRRAARELRTHFPNRPDWWAALIHSGL